MSALLSQALVAFTVEADNEAEHRLQHRPTRGDAAGASGPWLTSMLMWANCLRHLPDAGITGRWPSARSAGPAWSPSEPTPRAAASGRPASPRAAWLMTLHRGGFPDGS